MTQTDPSQSADCKVSVAMLAYNHEKFIAQAIESVLMQRVDFDFEIVVGEDCSTDGTRAIIEELADRNPGKIRLLTAEKNMGAHENERRVLAECRSPYLATIEGDDYWTSPDKLKRQVDFLDSHRDFTICFTSVKLDHDGPETVFPTRVKPITGLKDILEENYIPTCSALYRREALPEMPAWVQTLTMGDWPLHVFAAEKGSIGFIDEPMAAYRIHSGGMWSGMPLVKRAQEVSRFYDRINEHLGYRYDRLVKATQHYWLADAYQVTGDIENARRHARLCKGQGITTRYVTRAKLLRLSAKLSVPRLVQAAKSARTTVGLGRS